MQKKIISFLSILYMSASEPVFQLPSIKELNQIINSHNSHIIGGISTALAGKKLTEQQIHETTYDQLKRSFPNTKQIPKCNEALAYTSKTLTTQIINNLSNQ